MHNLTINSIQDSAQLLPLYEEHQGQEGPAYLYLDTRDGDVYLRGIHPVYASSWGVDEHNGHVRRWRIPNNLTERGYNEMLKNPKLVNLLARVYQGAEEYYDGNNYRTRLNEDAEEAELALDKLTEEINEWHDYECLEPWDAAMWLELASYENLVRDGETHEDAAFRLHDQARREGKYCSVGNIENVLDEMKENQED